MFTESPCQFIFNENINGINPTWSNRPFKNLTSLAQQSLRSSSTAPTTRRSIPNSRSIPLQTSPPHHLPSLALWWSLMWAWKRYPWSAWPFSPLVARSLTSGYVNMFRCCRVTRGSISHPLVLSTLSTRRVPSHTNHGKAVASASSTWLGVLLPAPGRTSRPIARSSLSSASVTAQLFRIWTSLLINLLPSPRAMVLRLRSDCSRSHLVMSRCVGFCPFYVAEMLKDGLPVYLKL